VALLVALGLSVAVAGCVSMPGGGPVLPYPATQGADPQNQNYFQFVPQPPPQNASPSEIVADFLAAGASFAGQQRVAREYLTAQASRGWKPGWSATVYKDGPAVSAARPGTRQGTASVTVSGSPQATLSSQQGYAVASETPKGKTYRYTLVKGRDGQWRISNAPNTLLLTSSEFGVDYQLADLYFFDPSMSYLVPDPVYVPLQATQGALVNGLVQDLINQPDDWLGEDDPPSPSRATYTAFPRHTALQGAVTVDGGTASVNLTGPGVSGASLTMKEQISAQLLCTLTGACQGEQQQVKSVALSIDGKLFVPPNASGNPVQHQAQYQPSAISQAQGLYYLTASGQLELQAHPQAKPVALASLGAGYSSLAVSPDGKYFAVVRKGNLYTGTVGDDHLAARGLGDGITSLSWDRGDNLWVVNSEGVATLSAIAGKSAPPPVPVGINNFSDAASCGSDSGDVVALRVAPDGVRVAIVYGGAQETLAFGAIARSGSAAQPLIEVNLSPFFVCKTAGAFTSLSWYGADDVVALDEPGNWVTDYPVNGGSTTTAEGPQGTSTSITASAAWGLVAAGNGTMSPAASLSSAWGTPDAGLSPAFPG
jgi:hypothetical protein